MNSVLRTLGCLSILCVTQPAVAQEIHPALTTNWWYNLGVFYPDHEFTVRVNSDILGPGSEISFESDLGLNDRAALFNGEIGWQFGERWGTSLQYFETHRTDRYVLEETYQWEDLVFDVGLSIRAGTGASVTRLAFFREFTDPGPHDFRLNLGIHYMTIDAFIAGDARLNDDSVEFRKSEAKSEAPLPNIGAWYRYSPSEKWLFEFRYDYFGADFGDYDGQMMNGVVGANYQIFDRFGIGLAYQRFHIDVRTKEENWKGRVDLTYHGPLLYISGYW